MSIDRRNALRSARRLVAGCVLVCFVVRAAGAQHATFPSDVRQMRTALRSASDDLRAASGDLRAASSDLRSASGDLRRPALGAFDVVALRVEFQPDTTRFTTGDGTFEGTLYDGLVPAIDPLPHDAGYVQAHLDFLSHYVDRVSDGMAQVRTHLVPEIVRLSAPMPAYAPTGPESDSDPELRKLALMVEEAWSLASERSTFDMSGFDPARTALILVHAGVGRDVELIGTTLDKTPQDLPSLFFDAPSLRRLLGSNSTAFNGFPVDHSILLPRTETRRAIDFIADEPFLLELSINGLLAASFFNYLGVPDLFDTQTGESAIGPFGLMDTQGIFAYRGLFPPEPMAWTKYFLGWTDPQQLRNGAEQTVTLHAASVPGLSASARAVVSGAEYFLVENRYRDPEQDGLTLRVWRDGEITEQHVENGDPDFNAFNVEGFVGGVVVGVDNYDWALPGGVDEDENELNGGILIWHIDERRLQAGFSENAVNVGVENRAVDLEEGDGAQDIGHPSSGPFGPDAELGSPFDFYFEGNPASVLLSGGREVSLYENRFGPDTFPSSETNSGGPSFIVLEDFSPPGAEMIFSYRQEASSGVEPLVLPAFDASIPGSGGEHGTEVAVFGPGSFVGCAVECMPFVYSEPSQVYFLPETGDSYSAQAAPITGRRIASLERSVPTGRRILVRDLDAADDDGAGETVIDLPEELSAYEPNSPLVRTSMDNREAYHVILTGDGRTHVVSASTEAVSISSAPHEDGAVSLALRETNRGRELVVVDRHGVTGGGADWTYSLSADDVIGQSVFGDDPGGFIGALPVVSSDELLLLGSDGTVTIVDVRSKAEGLGAPPTDSLGAYPILADFDEDGRLDILATYGSMLLAFTQSGALVRHFPIRLPSRIRSQPLAVRFGEVMGVVAAGDDGYLHAHEVSSRKRLVTGFPLEIGRAAPATPTFLNSSELIAISQEGELKGWRLAGATDVLWGRLRGSEDNGSYVRLEADDPAPGEGGEALINGDETYNWPNPIRKGTTNLRVATRRDAEVSIRIIDAAGRLVDEVELGNVQSGIPHEILWQADVSSGLYFARYSARTPEGEEDTKLVKMAVMR